MAVSQERITVYNLADLKNTTDDAIPNYLNSLSFRQSHRLTDVRLALGYSAFLLAGACFLWDYKLGFESTKYLTAAAVAVYTVLNGALTLWILYVERGTVYEGTAPSGETVRISTSTKKNVPTYYMTIEIEKKGKKEKLEVSRAFTEWFNAAGHFVAPPFQTVLASAVPVIGKLDPKRVASAAEGKDDAVPAYTPEMLAMLAEANVSVVGSAAETAASGAESSGKKGGKRRKA
ncbi:Signal peptidase complex subunit 2 [Madurella fahalii]|uniref:Signal peptidase complex subunit 2 n=1 Tax=Madurella fahalii TaxID=1157608 RepID=A0ABQ0G0N4_9PEZI